MLLGGLRGAQAGRLMEVPVPMGLPQHADQTLLEHPRGRGSGHWFPLVPSPGYCRLGPDGTTGRTTPSATWKVQGSYFMQPHKDQKYLPGHLPAPLRYFPRDHPQERSEAENAPWAVVPAVKECWRVQPIMRLEHPTGRAMVPTVRV